MFVQGAGDCLESYDDGAVDGIDEFQRGAVLFTFFEGGSLQGHDDIALAGLQLGAGHAAGSHHDVLLAQGLKVLIAVFVLQGGDSRGSGLAGAEAPASGDYIFSAGIWARMNKEPPGALVIFTKTLFTSTGILSGKTTVEI